MIFDMISVGKNRHPYFKTPAKSKLISGNLFLICIAVLAIVSNHTEGYAVDFTVNTPTTVTNGSATNNLTGTDSLTITSDGEIVVTGDHAVDASGNTNVISNDGLIEAISDNFNGINLQNDDNTVTNSSSGRIITNGIDSIGIEGGNDNVIINDGQITANGVDARGIDVSSGNHITNNGSISTGIDGQDAISLFQNNRVTNSGTITTLGDNAEAIAGNSDNIVVNNGIIRTSGTDSHGIYLTDDVFITNNGSIVIVDGQGMRGTSSATITNNGSVLIGDGEGINAEGDAVVINRGTIEVTGSDTAYHGIDVTSGTVLNIGSVVTWGVGTDAIEVIRDTTVTNFGKVISAGSRSFHFSDSSTVTGNNTLNLLAPSFIGGEIDLGSAFTTDTIVNITTGASHSVLWDFSTGDILGGDPTINGTVPWFYNSITKQIATFDPSVLAASVESLTDRTALISGTIQRRLEAAELMVNGVKRGKPGDDYSSGSSTFDKSGVWLQVMASHSEYAGGAATLERDITLGGFAIGYDANRNQDTRFGVMAGYIDGSSEAASRWSNSFKGNSSGFFAAGYGRKSLGQMFVDLGLSAGIGIDNETKRFVNDNLAALGESYAKGDGGVSFWISPEVAIGTQFKGSSKWTFAPTAKLRYAAEWLGGYTETGPSADANATVENRMIAMGEAKLELAASRHLNFGPAMHALFTARGGVQGRASLGDDTTISLLGVTQDVSDFYQDGFSIFAGMDTSIAMSEMINLDLSTSATFGNDQSNIQGAAAVSVLF